MAKLIVIARTPRVDTTPPNRVSAIRQVLRGLEGFDGLGPKLGYGNLTDSPKLWGSAAAVLDCLADVLASWMEPTAGHHRGCSLGGGSGD